VGKSGGGKVLHWKGSKPVKQLSNKYEEFGGVLVFEKDPNNMETKNRGGFRRGEIIANCDVVKQLYRQREGSRKKFGFFFMIERRVAEEEDGRGNY